MAFEAKLLDEQVQDMDSLVIQQHIDQDNSQDVSKILWYFEITKYNPILKREGRDTGKQNNQYEYKQIIEIIAKLHRKEIKS